MTSQQGLELLAPLDYQQNPSGINVDVVAVPGLGADPSKSFGSETPGGFNWLSDGSGGIRSDIPGARVLLYHYDSRWLGGEAKPQTLYNVANLLLDSLVENRKGDGAEGTRPLVFLAHSMGGLVVAKALTLAAAQPEKIDYMRIFECFAGAIFFGTPFKGSSAQAKAFLLATFLEKVGGAIPNRMLQLLDPGQDSLEELRGDFINLAFKEPKANIACIYELAKTNYVQEKFSQWLPKNLKLGPAEIVVTQDSATLDGAATRGLPCNHRQLNRFNSAKDGSYEVVRHHLKGIVEKAQQVVRARLRASRQSPVDDTTFQLLSESLNVVDIQYKRRAIEKTGGDSSWILQEHKYLQWSTQADTIQAPEYPCVWVSGDEGLGKSKAAVAVVQDLEKREASNNLPGARNVMVAYFFCESNADCSLAENMFKSLMWQLILKRRSLAQYAKTFAAQKKTKGRGSGQGTDLQFSLSKLRQGLTEMLRDPSVQEVYFIVNSLHYLSEDNSSTAEFLEIISDVLQSDQTAVEDPLREKVRWMFFSRDRDNIKAVLQEGHESRSLGINLNDGSMSSLRRQQVRSYTRDRVKSLARTKDYSLALQYFVFSILEKRAESNTVWVDVVCRLLEEMPANFTVVRRTLELLPQDLEILLYRTWTEELTRAEKDGINSNKEILRTLLVAYEDPTLYELCVLAELDIDIDADDSEETENKILSQVRACGPLLRVYDASDLDETEDYGDAGTRVTFIHPLAKDILLKPELRKLIGFSEEDDYQKADYKWQHGVVGLRCFSYMLTKLGTVDDSVITWERTAPTTVNQDEAEIDELFPHTDEDEEDEDDEVDSYALEYPLKYWLRHGYEATPDFVDILDIKRGFWSHESSARKRWWGSYARKDGSGEPKNMTALHIAAWFGLLPLVESLLVDGHEEEIQLLDSWDNQPLHWAASRGHTKVCKTLLEKGADINNGRKTRVWTPLHMAAAEGQLEVMRFLLTYNGPNGPADINAVANEVGTPLTLALSWRQTNAAELLLQYSADPTLTAEDSDSPIALAALWGYESLVEKLLQLGGSRNLKSHEYGSALAAAASAGNSGIVQTLLALDRNQSSRQRALEEAASAGFDTVVDLILRSSERLPCSEAFETAAFYGNDQIVKQLWSYHQYYHVISPNAVSNALYQAAEAQQESTVNFLLRECRANPNATGEEYGNALTASAFDGTTTIVQTLIQFGANVNAAEGHALQAAASNGYTDIVQLLIDRGADVNAFSERVTARTALQAACGIGNVDIVRILINQGAHPDYGGGDFSNPLIAATSHGYGELVELLLQAGANPNVFGGPDGSTPLINAAMSLPGKCLDLLIRHGAVVDQKDPDEDTALIISALVGDRDCVNVLLNHGADINLGGKHYGTPLHAAASRGHTDVCQLLLQRGANANVYSGPFRTVLQAAAASGDQECLKMILDHDKRINIDVQGGEHFTALHAAAVQAEDGCLQQLLKRHPKLNTFSRSNGSYGNIGTPLQVAAFTGCNRNARLLLEAEADPNIVSGKHGTALQAAALKCDAALCELLLDHGARVDGWSGKYGSALVAAVARDNDEDDQDRHQALSLLLEQESFPPKAYTAALEMALKLRRREDFKLVLAAMKARASKNAKNFPNIKKMMAQFKAAQLSTRQTKRGQKTNLDDDKNSDFGDDVINQYQDIYNEIYEEPQQDQSTQENEAKQDGGRNISAGNPQANAPDRDLPVQSGPQYDGAARENKSQEGAGIEKASAGFEGEDEGHGEEVEDNNNEGEGHDEETEDDGGKERGEEVEDDAGEEHGEEVEDDGGEAREEVEDDDDGGEEHEEVEDDGGEEHGEEEEDGDEEHGEEVEGGGQEQGEEPEDDEGGGYEEEEEEDDY